MLTRLIKAHYYLLLAAIPLIFWLDTQTIFALPKLASLQLISLSAGIFMTLQVFLSDRFTFRWQKNYLFLGLWLLSLVLSTIFTLNLHTSLFGQYGRFLGIFTMLNFTLIPIFITNYFQPKDLPKIFRFSLIIATLVAAYGLLQYFNFFGLWQINSNWSDSPQNRVFSTIGHANHLGGYLGALLAMLLYSGIFNWSKKTTQTKSTFSQKLKSLIRLAASAVIAALLFTTLLLTASRGAILALLLTIAILSVLTLINHWPKLRSKFLKITATVILLLTIFAGTIYFSWDSLNSLGLFKRTEATIATLDKGKIPDRLSFLYSALAMFQTHSITGTGLSTFRDAYNQFRRADYYIDGPGNAQFITTPEAAHNEYANILATQGLVGLLAYLALIFTLLKILGHGYLKSNNADFKSHLPLLAGLLVFLIQTIFNFTEIVNLSLFYSIIGFVFLTDQTTTFKVIQLKLKPLWRTIVTIFLMILIVAYAFFFWLPEAQTDYYIRRAENADLLNKTAQSQENWVAAITSNPSEYSLYQSLADLQIKGALLATSQNDHQLLLKQAAQNYLKAISLNNNYPSAYHNLALTYLELFRATKLPAYAELSQENYQLCIQKSPNNPRFLYEYARKLHSDFNDKPQAVKLLKQALEIDPEYQEPQDYLNFLYKNHPELKNG